MGDELIKAGGAEDNVLVGGERTGRRQWGLWWGCGSEKANDEAEGEGEANGDDKFVTKEGVFKIGHEWLVAKRWFHQRRCL